MASVNLGRVGFVPKGDYVAGTAYVKYDIVSYNGSNYVAQASSTGVTPGSDATKWKLFIDNTAATNAATAANTAATTANNAATTAANAVSYIAQAETSSTAAHAYSVGDQLVYNGTLYTVTAAITIGDTLATTGAGANIAAVPGGVTGEITDLKSAVNEISSTDIMSHVPYSSKKYIKYSTGELTSTSNTTLRVYTLENNGFKHVHVKLYAADANSAAIAFYSTTTIGTDSYMGSASVQCSAGWHEYSALVPNGCVIIAFTHRTSDSTDTPYIKYTIVNEFNPYPDNLNNIKAHNMVRSVNHRGWHNAPENTIPAYRESKAQGFNSVECDVRFTSDDVPVLIHDETINRTARNSDGSTISETIYINSITYQEALAYDFGIYKGSGYAGTKIPTMSDFLKTCRNLGLTPYVEIEGTPSATRFANLVEVVKQSGIAANITWISASNASLMTMMSAFPSNRYGLIPWTYSDTYRDTAKGMFNGKAEVFIDMNVSQITDTICANCAADNIPIEVWTVDNAETIQGLNSYVSGVTSNALIASVILEEAEND